MTDDRLLPFDLPSVRRKRMIVRQGPKHACRGCEEGVTQAPVPARLIEGGQPTEGAIAHVLVSRYAEHTPLYRQSAIETVKLNGVEPYAWLKDTLEAIATGHPNSRIDELLPWSVPTSSS